MNLTHLKTKTKMDEICSCSYYDDKRLDEMRDQEYAEGQDGQDGQDDVTEKDQCDCPDEDEEAEPEENVGDEKSAKEDGEVIYDKDAKEECDVKDDKDAEGGREVIDGEGGDMEADTDVEADPKKICWLCHANVNFTKLWKCQGCMKVQSPEMFFKRLSEIELCDFATKCSHSRRVTVEKSVVQLTGSGTEDIALQCRQGTLYQHHSSLESRAVLYDLQWSKVQSQAVPSRDGK